MDSVKGTIQIRDVVFFYFINFGGLFTRKDHLTLEFCLQFRQHGNVSIIKMWSFLKHYDEAQPGKRKTASATPTED
jgi:hypothetical protein